MLSSLLFSGINFIYNSAVVQMNKLIVYNSVMKRVG